VRLGRHVDDGTLIGLGCVRLLGGPEVFLGVDPAAADAPGGAFGLDGGPVREIGVEEEFQIGTQRGQFGAQRRHLVGGLRPQLRGQLAAQMRFDGELVLPSRGDLAIELQVVHELEVAHLGLVGVALPAVDDRDERGDHGRPQRENHGQLEQFDAVGENQR
jgi:hypothetical protein